MRRQTDTLFQYSVDVSFAPTVENEEVGVTIVSQPRPKHQSLYRNAARQFHQQSRLDAEASLPFSGIWACEQ
jgi:hypothetical protein